MTAFHSVPHGDCTCHAHQVERRGFLKLAALGAGAVATGALFSPFAAFAKAKADILLLSCMDYRLVSDVPHYMTKRGLYDKYDQVVLAGASLAAVTDKFPDWNKTFWQHLDVAIQLHGVNTVIAIDHRDCGAYNVVFGKDFVKDPMAETKIHTEVMAQFDKAITAKHPTLKREYYLMNLDGKVEPIKV